MGDAVRLTWCSVCGGSHAKPEDCPGDLRAPGPYGFDKAAWARAQEAYAKHFGGDTEKSSVSYRMALRGMFDDIPAQDQMPPLATEHADMTGINAVNTWIKTLPPPADR